MNAPQIVIESTASALCERGATLFRDIAEKAIKARGRFDVALSGGSTPRELYQILASRGFRQQIDWTKTHFFFGDERSVPPEDPDSNFRMAREALFEKIPLEDSQIHRMFAEQVDLEAAAAGYEIEVREAFGVESEGAAPAFDLILLGMGPVGHTASLFPQTTALEETTRWVVANDVPQLKTRRMTMTTPLINAARTVLFLVAGEAKASVLFEVLYGERAPEIYPSQLIVPAAGSLIFLLDRAAAAELPQTIDP